MTCSGLLAVSSVDRSSRITTSGRSVPDLIPRIPQLIPLVVMQLPLVGISFPFLTMRGKRIDEAFFSRSVGIPPYICLRLNEPLAIINEKQISGKS